MDEKKQEHNNRIPNDEMNVIQIALSIYDPFGTYTKHAGATLVSVFTNTSFSVCVHILHDSTLTQENRDKICKIADEYQQKIQFYIVDLPKHMMDLSCGKLTTGTLFRLLAPNILKEKKIIYLDCDVIVDLDIKKLWDIPVMGYPVAAVLDKTVQCGKTLSTNGKNIIKKSGIKLDKYFNAGVLVLNLEYLRNNHNLSEEACRFFTNYENVYVDQDALNFLFQDNFLQLDDTFNSITMVRGDDYLKGRIWHWAGQKPWDGFTGIIDTLYWNSLSLTPWRDESSTFLSMIKQIENLSASGKKLIIFGTGSYAERTWRRLSKTAQYFVDNDSKRWNTMFHGHPIYSPRHLLKEDKEKVIVIIGSQYHDEISRQLIDMGFTKYVHFL